MKLIIANCTQQNHDFLYRTIEHPAVRSRPIAIGGQIEISGNLNSEDVDYIIGQHTIYGMVRVDEIDRTKPYIGLCYSIDKPIPVEKLRIALAHNSAVLTERGRQIRKEAAVVAAGGMDEDDNTGLKAMELSVVEERKDGGTPEVNEGVRVSRYEPETQQPAPRQRRRG